MRRPEHVCEVELLDLGQVGLVSFRGSGLFLDELAMDEVQRRLEDWTAALDRSQWVIDFAGVEYLTSRMLGLLVALHRRLRERGSRLRLCGLAAHLAEVFTATRLDRVLDVTMDRGSERREAC